MQNTLIEMEYCSISQERRADVLEVIHPLEFSCYICSYVNHFCYSTVAHKGFPKQQYVVDAIEEICGPPRAGNELDFRQKRDFLDFIRGESDNSHYEFCTCWVTTLALREFGGYMRQELPEKLHISVHTYHCFFC